MKLTLLLALPLLTIGATTVVAVPSAHATLGSMVALDDHADPMISINPGNGGSVHPGGTVFVDNWTPVPADLKITLDDGTLMYVATIPPYSINDYQVPLVLELLGRKLKVSVVAGPTTASAEIKIN